MVSWDGRTLWTEHSKRVRTISDTPGSGGHTVTHLTHTPGTCETERKPDTACVWKNIVFFLWWMRTISDKLGIRQREVGVCVFALREYVSKNKQQRKLVFCLTCWRWKGVGAVREGGLGLWKDDWRSVKEEMVEVVEGLRTPTKGFNSHSLLYRVG